jgi:hypothetical protein
VSYFVAIKIGIMGYFFRPIFYIVVSVTFWNYGSIFIYF